MHNPAKTHRVTSLMTLAEVWQVDVWRQQQHTLSSRGEAIRQLVELGLKASKAASKVAEARN